eukprot:scaffold952_cov409-Prasinococcus_capsulatus_cf.AAC.38
MEWERRRRSSRASGPGSPSWARARARERASERRGGLRGAGGVPLAARSALGRCGRGRQGRAKDNVRGRPRGGRERSATRLSCPPALRAPFSTQNRVVSRSCDDPYPPCPWGCWPSGPSQAPRI